MEKDSKEIDCKNESIPVEFRNWDDIPGADIQPYISAGMGYIVIDAIFLKEQQPETNC